MERLEDEQLDDELTDWHEGEVTFPFCMFTASLLIQVQDEMLTIAFQAAEQDFRKHLEKLEEKKWKTVSESVGSKLGRKKYTAKACKERHDGLQDGSADMAIEKDPDQNGRAIKREQRIADAKRRRAEFVEAERMAKEEKARLAAEEKERKLKWRAEIEKYRETRKAEREEDARLKAEKKFGKEEERKSRAAGFRFLRSEAAERAGVREAEERIFNYYTGRDLVRKHANRVKGDYGDDFADSDDDGNADYLRDSDDDDGSGADDASTASYKPKPKKRAVAPAPPKSATVTKVTLRNPRSIMTDDELDVLIFERRLERRGPTEVHPEVVARLAAADATLSSSTLNSLLEKHFEPTKGKRSVRVDRLQKADAANCAAGKNGLDVTDLEFQDTYEGYKGEYAHTITY
jgi:hypothetical protein